MTDADVTNALPLTHVAYHVLLALATRNRHGYGIIKDVAENTAGALELDAGTLYGAVKRMKDEGWIGEAPTPTGLDARRRTYTLLPLGRRILRAESRRLENLVELARSARLLPRASKRT
jgi:DNA-binding PadR family transcriptional regulator